MNILVDITHPAHVHFFRNAINIWRQRGHKVTITARDKDIALQLLNQYGYEYICLSRARPGIVGLGLELLEHEGKLLRIIANFKPEVLLEIGGPFIVHAGKLTRTPALVFSDTEHARVSNAITYPFAAAICTPSCYRGDLGAKHIRYYGYHELAYLHPNYFTPNPAVLEEIGAKLNQRIFLIRFVSWTASHDTGQAGFSLEGKRELVQRLSKLGQVIITSEAQLPPEFEPYRMAISPTKIHDLLYYSSLYIGEGGTMASEAAVLGTPSIYVNSLTMGYLEEQEQKYGLLHRITKEQQAIKLAVNLARDNMREAYQQKRQHLLADKIDVTVWLVDFVERYGQGL